MWRGVNTQILEKDINNTQTRGRMLARVVVVGGCSPHPLFRQWREGVNSPAWKARRHPLGHRG